MGTSLAAERFTAYGASHQVALALLVVGAVALAWYGRAHRGDGGAVRLGRVLTVAILVFTVPLQVLYLTPDYWELERALPLNLCDLAWMVAAYALWARRRWAVALTYYWGLTLTTQAVLTPDLAAEFPDPVFFLFWGLHLLVVWAAVYVTWGLGLAPDWRGYRVAMLVTAGWAVCVFCFNLAVGTNYGYLNAKPESASILDLLGPWPWYVLAEIGIVAVFWALITWPWVAAAGRGAPGSGTPGPAARRRMRRRRRATGERPGSRGPVP
jgi:hypothetical integral membrane protein (TIGR02206 family)